MKEVLVTGGLGFIGSETVVTLIEHGYHPVIVDDCSNAKEAVLERIETITGFKPSFYKIDIRDHQKLHEVFKEHSFFAVLHFAGFKAVGESVQKPLEYYENNLGGALSLLRLMKEFMVKNLIFSSSATVYGNPTELPLLETMERKEATNPYGETKIMIERISEDYVKANPEWNVILLRYFNPIGAHPSSLLGEDPQGIPNNLLPYVSQVAIGKRDHLTVFGNDYDTPDGTCIRDYLHVLDLAEGHVAALKKIEEKPGLEIYNLGTGHGSSVLEIIRAYEEATGLKIPYEIGPRRAGDVPVCYAGVEKAKKELHWEAKRSLKDACLDAYNFQKRNPDGIK